ncbi:ATP-binding protein [Chryseolinea sp. H1M3-3]|uniref:sensor histidine kinase n=1 Tax=Chryseolinea sp. H1M3-3 TaxID=3034144 RepID=UPI0023EAE74B|nr:ATP-binding protein [Chryseolinea sp. H1M3-3]
MYPEQLDLPWVVIVATSVIVMISLGLIILFLIFQNKRYHHLKDTQTLKDKFTQTLLESQLEIKEQTLQHIAYELHDNLGQVASLIKINLNTLKLQDQEGAIRKIEDTKELIRQLISDLKSLSISLNGDRVVQLGILKVLENEVDRLNKTNQFTATIVQDGAIPKLDDNTLVILYRMVQEILNNTVKHSGANRVRISLQRTENLFILGCDDNGVGYNWNDKILSGGSGLLNLQHRAKSIGAKLAVKSSRETGTSILIELPL